MSAIGNRNAVKHGHCPRTGRPPEYEAWRSMNARCYNPRRGDYRRYGGRGITVCDRWRHSFENFLADMGPRPSPTHSLDRVNNDGSYEKDNCRWATRIEQQRNTRHNHYLTAFNRTQCVSAWAEEFGMSKTLLLGRLKRGMTVEDALNKPRRAVA